MCHILFCFYFVWGWCWWGTPCWLVGLNGEKLHADFCNIVIDTATPCLHVRLLFDYVEELSCLHLHVRLVIDAVEELQSDIWNIMIETATPCLHTCKTWVWCMRLRNFMFACETCGWCCWGTPCWLLEFCVWHYNSMFTCDTCDWCCWGTPCLHVKPIIDSVEELHDDLWNIVIDTATLCLHVRLLFDVVE